MISGTCWSHADAPPVAVITGVRTEELVETNHISHVYSTTQTHANRTVLLIFSTVTLYDDWLHISWYTRANVIHQQNACLLTALYGLFETWDSMGQLANMPHLSVTSGFNV